MVESLTEVEKLRFEEIWATLTKGQRNLAIAMLDYATKKEAAEAIGLSPQTAYNWNGQMSEVIELLRRDREQTALVMLHQSLGKAVMVKINGLDSENEKIQQDVSTEIIDRQLGKAPLAITHSLSQTAMDWLTELRGNE